MFNFLRLIFSLYKVFIGLTSLIWAGGCRSLKLVYLAWLGVQKKTVGLDWVSFEQNTSLSIELIYMHLDLQYFISLNCLKRCWFYNSKGFKVGFNRSFIMPEGEENKWLNFFWREKEKGGRVENLCNPNCWLCNFKKLL